VFAPFFEIAAAEKQIVIPQVIGGGALKVTAQRQNGFEDKINLAIEGLPPGLTAEIPAIEPKQGEATIKLAGGGTLPAGTNPIRVIATAEFQNQPRRVEISDVAVEVVPPVEVSATAAGPLRAGGAQSVKLTLRRHGEITEGIRIALAQLPVGIEAPVEVVVAADQSEVDVQLQARPEAPLGAFALRAIAQVAIAGRQVSVTSEPVAIEVMPAETVPAATAAAEEAAAPVATNTGEQGSP
jgi:hypothetical protein